MPGASESGAIVSGRFRFLPVVPGRVEFAVEVRRALLQTQPKLLAIELPQMLANGLVRAMRRLPEMSVLLYSTTGAEDEGVYLPVEPADPFIEAVRSGQEIAADLVFIEPDVLERPHIPAAYPDSYALRHIGYERYVAEYRRLIPSPTPDMLAHAAGIAWKLQGSDPTAEVTVVLSLNLLDAVIAALEIPQDAPEQRPAWPAVEVLNPHPESLAEITVEYPFLQDRYEQYRFLMEQNLIDRPRVQHDLLREAEVAYQKNTGDKILHWHRRLIARYSRNLALTANELTANLFDLTVAARSIVDDNFGWEVWETAGRYPAQREESDVETVRISGEEVFSNTRKLRIRRRLPRPKQQLRPPSLKPRPKEKKPGEWARELHGDSICSYPPEDLVVEEYGRALKQKAKLLVSQERQRVERFTTSMLDGIDLRETIRNWHEKKIFVRQAERNAGSVGSVVVIFDEDPDDRYRYLTTWLGENQNESDMAFYSTYPFHHLVGPGIGRAEYGGFLMSLPARRMYDVWGDPDYDYARTKSERLLLAALDYSLEKNIAYVAAKPPRSVFRSIAARMGRQIVYIPIGQLASDKLKKVRVVHVLDSYERRKNAKNYLW